MVQFTKIFLLYALQHLYVTAVTCSEFEAEILASKNSMDINVKIPRLIKRYYSKWTSSPQNNSNILHSIPVEVKELEDETLLMTAPYRENNNPILKAYILIEFSDVIAPTELHFKKYYAELTPVVRSDGKTTPKHGCSSTSAVSRSRFVGNLLEMKFSMRHLYAGCKRVDKKLFKFKFRLLGLDGQPADVDMRTQRNEVFILIKEGFSPSSASIIPAAAVEKTLQHIRDRTEKLRKAPEQRQFRYTSKERIQKGRQGRIGKMKKAPQLRHHMRPWRKNEPCQIQNLNVNFASIGWDWIVAPDSYDIYRCYGRCHFPMADHFNATGHAILQTIMYSIMGTPPGACCVPKDLGPLTVIYVDGQSVALRSFPDMVVKSCACR